MEISEHHPLEINYVGGAKLTSLLYLIATCIVKLLLLGRTLSTVEISVFVLSDFQHQIHSNVREGFSLLWLILYNRLNITFSSSCEIHIFLCCVEYSEVMVFVRRLAELQK